MIFLSNCLHVSGEELRYPKWDTLIGIFNGNGFDITARLEIFKDNGDPLPLVEFQVEKESSFALTFIPNNGLPNPPQDFFGHAQLSFYEQTAFGPKIIDNDVNIYVWSMMSGLNWDSKAPSVENPCLRFLQNTRFYVLPYAIPNYENPDHLGVDGYITGLSIQNFSPYETEIDIHYIVGQAYGNKGTEFSVKEMIPANGGLRKHLHELLPALLEFNSEGHVIISCMPSAKLLVSSITATRNYLFSAGQVAQ